MDAAIEFRRDGCVRVALVLPRCAGHVALLETRDDSQPPAQQFKLRVAQAPSELHDLSREIAARVDVVGPGDGIASRGQRVREAASSPASRASPTAASLNLARRSAVSTSETATERRELT